MFRDAFEQLPVKGKDTLYYHEWAKAEGKAKNHAISAWLDGIALADGIPAPERDDKYTPADHIIISLDGISANFEHLFERTNNPTFRNAWGTAVQLGLRLEGTQKTANARQRLRRSQKRYSKGGSILPATLEHIQKGIIAAYKLREVTLPGTIRSATELTFSKLLD